MKTFIAGCKIEKNQMVYIGEDGKLYPHPDKEEKAKQHFSSFFDEFTFGKLGKEQKTLMEAIETDWNYVNWCLEHEIISIDEKIENRFNRKMGYE